MKANRILLILMIFGLGACSASRAPEFEFAGNVPAEELSASPVITALERDQIWQDFTESFRNEFAARHLHPVLTELDELGFGAFAQRNEESTEARVYLSRGTRYHRRMTANLLRLILCHEVGHHLGGAPFSARANWSSAEGQADDFATRICWKKIHPDPETEISEPQNNWCRQRAPFFPTGLCAAALSTASQLVQILSGLKGLEQPNLSLDALALATDHFEPDLHPALDCRWQIFRDGLSSQNRSDCWFQSSP